MIQEIKMPSAGQTTDEARIVAINVKVGDSVKRGDVLVEAETDKAVLPVESYAAGEVLAVLISVGDKVDAGTVLIAVGSKGEIYGQKAAPAVEAPKAAPASKVGTEIKMPSAGQTTDEAKIVSVNVKIGDNVKRGDVLMEAETDKAVLPVESFAAGQVLDILVQVGDTVTAGTVLAVVGKAEDAAKYTRNGAAASAPAVEQTPVVEKKAQEEYLPIIKGQKPYLPAPAAAVPAVSAAPAKKYPAMPNAKALAKEKNIDLAQVNAANGQFIKRQDVLSHTPAACGAAEYEALPMSRMRKVIARRMVESVQQIPAFQCTVSVNMDQCISLRAALLKNRNVKVSYNDILAKAISVAAKKFTLINARYEGDEVRVYKHTNVGLAVGLEAALVVPVVKEIDTKGLETVAAEYKALVKKARENKLSPADMGCGSITISNLGMYDVDCFTAIVNPPESAILAVGSIKTEPVWDGNGFVPVRMMRITGSFDHRIIDGAYGAQFLQEVKTLLEQPALMFI